MEKKAAFSIPSIISFIAAILTFASGAFFGLIWAGVAVVFGLIGVLLSLAPSVRGGFLSTFGVLGGLIGVVAAIIKTIAYFVS